MYFASGGCTKVLPPSKIQKAQKPHSCAVFLLIKCFIFFRVQDGFLLEKNSSLFFKFFLCAVQPAFSTVSDARRGVFCCFIREKTIIFSAPVPVRPAHPPALLRPRPLRQPAFCARRLPAFCRIRGSPAPCRRRPDSNSRAWSGSGIPLP